MSKRNIYFYRLKVSHNLLENDTSLKEDLSKEDVFNFMQSIYEDLKSNEKGYKYIKYDFLNQYYLIEFIEFSKDSTFIRLGKQNANNEVGKRNIESCNLEDIPLGNGELIEAYTYLYIDFKTDVISFVRVGGAPTTKWFEIPLTSYYTNSGYKVSCIPFTTDEILNSYSSNSEIGSITITTIKPTLEVASILRGIQKKDVEDFNSYEMNLSLSIKPKQKGGNTTDLPSFRNLFNKVKENDKRLKKFVLNIADENEEKKKVVDLMNYRFTRSSDIQSNEKLTPEQYKHEIVKVYNRELITLRKLFKI